MQLVSRITVETFVEAHANPAHMYCFHRAQALQIYKYTIVGGSIYTVW